jgi:dolichol-phosphate mannosyltransferase
VLTLVAAVIYVVLWAVGSPPPGVTTLLVLTLLAIGLNSLGIGILGEYMGRTYFEVKGRPLYVIDETMNLGGRRQVASERRQEAAPDMCR